MNFIVYELYLTIADKKNTFYNIFFYKPFSNCPNDAFLFADL